MVKTVKVDKGFVDNVGLVTQSKVVVTVRKGEEKGYQGRIDVPETVVAPIKKGQKIGEYVVTKNDQEVLKVPLLANNNVDRRTFTQQINKTLRGILE